MRGDVKITDDDLVLIAEGKAFGKIGAHGLQEIELVTELIIHFPVGDVPASRDIKIMQLKIAFIAARRIGDHARTNVAGMIQRAEGCGHSFQRQLRNRGRAVISFHPAHFDMGVAERFEVFARKLFGQAFDFLQAKNIRLSFFQEIQDQRLAQANGVDIPGSDRDGHRPALTKRGEPVIQSDATEIDQRRRSLRRLSSRRMNCRGSMR